MGDKVDFSGDFRGAIVNFKSTLTNVRQTVKAVPMADDAEKEELERLVVELSTALESLSADKGELAEALAQQTQSLIEEATKEEPNKTMLGISANGLKQAAGTVADVAPKVLQVATQIAEFVMKLAG